MSRLLFLGRPAFDPKPFTRVEPLALAEEGSWKVYAEWSNALPTEGRAFASRLPGFNSRSLVAFGIEPNDQERDHFVVADPRRVSEVLDFRNVEAEAARRRLVEVGLPRLLGGSEDVVAALPGGLCVVVQMVRHPSRDLWVADIDGLEHLSTHLFDERLFAGDQVEGRWVTVPGITVGAPTGVVNWCRDSDFLDAVLKRLRKAAPQASGSPTRTQIAQIVTQLNRADLLPADGADIEPMRDRLRDFAPWLGQNIRALDEIVEILGALSPVRQRLAAEMSEQRALLEREMRQELEEKLLRELDESFTELTAERDRLAEEVTALASDLEARRAEFDEERRTLASERSGLANDLTQLLADLGEEPLPAEAGVTRLSARIAAKLGETGAAFEVAAQGGPPWTTTRRTMSEPTPWSELDRVLQAAALRWGFAHEDLQAADVATRGGALVVLPEERASRFVECYAEALAGGGYARHVLDPSVISVDDLWRQPGSGRHGCFARAWSAAKLDPGRFQVLLLDGLHRTPSALWMGSLLDVLRDARRPRNLLMFASLGALPIDRLRSWRGPSEGAVALAPMAADGLSPGLLARVAGVARTSLRFDAGQAPEPTAGEVMDFTTILEGEAAPGMLEVACAVHRAAWPFGSERAATIARAVAGLGKQGPAALVSGAAWLRERLQDVD